MMQNIHPVNMFIFISVMITMSCQRDVNISLGDRYSLITSARLSDLTIVKENKIQVIAGHILDYAFDSTFILVVQRPRDSISGIESLTANEYEEKFEQSTFRQYWIINKKQQSVFDDQSITYSNVYGPFRKEEYLQKCEEIRVPQTLALKQ